MEFSKQHLTLRTIQNNYNVYMYIYQFIANERYICVSLT